MSPQRIMALVVAAALLVTLLTFVIYGTAQQSPEGRLLGNPKKRTPFIKRRSALCSFAVVCLATCVSVVLLFSLLTALSWLIIMARDTEFSSRLKSELTQSTVACTD